MNKDKTTIEREALEWWEKLHPVTAITHLAKYFPDATNCTKFNQIVSIYKAEHPTAPTVKEDSSSEDTFEAKLRKQYDNVGYDSTDHPLHLYMAGGSYAKILLEADNNALREALENMFGMFNNPVVRLKMGHTFTDFHREAIESAREALEQTK